MSNVVGKSSLVAKISMVMNLVKWRIPKWDCWRIEFGASEKWDCRRIEFGVSSLNEQPSDFLVALVHPDGMVQLVCCTSKEMKSVDCL
jgi:hypothetical protein